MTTADTDPPTLEVDHLRLDIPVRGKLATIIHDVSLTIGKGQTLALVGESGSGKSMTARAVMRMLVRGARVGGDIRFAGRSVFGLGEAELRAWRGHDVAMIYQSPYAHINPVRTIGDFLTEALRHHDRLSRAEAEARVIALLAEVDIPDGARRLRQYPHQLSGGQLQRVMIVAALAAQPRLLLADEPTTALDVTTQAEVMAILAEVQKTHGLSVLLITHDLDLAAATADGIAVMYAGMIVETAAAGALVEDPRHPYTVGLLAARPALEDRGRLRVIPGSPASGFEVGPGCVFAGRCPFATPLCRGERPALRPLGAHMVACHRAEELHGAMDYPAEEDDRG